jgi:GAF domain-containing protein
VRDATRREQLYVLLLTLVVVGLLVAQVGDHRQFSRHQVGVGLEVRDGDVFITGVSPGFPAAEAGLAAGDRILEIGGRPVRQFGDIRAETVAAAARQEPLAFVVEREGAILETHLAPGAPFPLFTFSVTAVTTFFYLLIGYLALVKRPGYLRARLLFLLTAAVAIELAMPSVRNFATPWLLALLMLNGFQMAVELHLASVIPERQSWLRRLPSAIPAYYVVGLGASALVALLVGLYQAGQPLMPWPGDVLYRTFSGVQLPLWAFGVLALLGWQALTYPERKGRQQAGLVALGVVPWALVVVAVQAGWLHHWVSLQWQPLVWNAALFLYPLAVFVILLRERADQERILLDLADGIQRVSSVSEISRLVSSDLHSAFHPKCTHVFYRERHSRDLTLGHSTGMRLEEEQIPESSVLLRLMSACGKAVDYPGELAGLPPEEEAWLERLEARLIVPLSGRDQRLLGLLILGQKKSEEPYTHWDRKLLQAIATQIALVYENARLKDRVDQSQRMQREVFSRLGREELHLVSECPACGRCYDASQGNCEEDRSELETTVPVERLISQRYRLERRIDRGGMGAIYEAWDLKLHRSVAVKVLHGPLLSDTVHRRFEIEARLTAALRHPHVVTVFDYGATESGAPFLIMELLRGRTLAAILKQEGRLTPPTAAELFDQACEGVKAAHRAEIIHRDLKPANLFVTEDDGSGPLVKILDFGVAKLRSAAIQSAAGVTSPGMLVGTFHYMAPEQLAGDPVDERSDVFALAVMVAEALTGRRPFSGEGPAELLVSISKGRIAPIGYTAASRALDEILRVALALRADSRHPSVAALQEELIPALSNLPAMPTGETASGTA